MGVRHMQGVSAHLTTLKSKDGKRRHKARCTYYNKQYKMCTCPINTNFYRSTCGGSSKCDYYEEMSR